MSRLFNWAAFLLFGIFALSILDATLGFVEPKTRFRIVQGTSSPISGDLDSDAGALELLADLKEGDDLSHFLGVETNGPLVVHFAALRGRTWRGELEAPADMPSGEYALAVFQKGYPPPPEAPRMQVRVFESQAALRRDVPGFLESRFGIKAWVVTLCAIPLGLMLLYLSYREADQGEERLRRHGVGAIYKLAKRKEGWEVVCGLGRRDGVEPGDTLTVIDDAFHCVAAFVPEQVEADHCVALLPLDIPIKARHRVVNSRGVVSRVD